MAANKIIQYNNIAQLHRLQYSNRGRSGRGVKHSSEQHSPRGRVTHILSMGGSPTVAKRTLLLKSYSKSRNY